MPYGRKQNYKGRGKQFTRVEDLELQREQDMRQEGWRNKKEEESSSSSEEDSDSEAVIEVHNPNRIKQKNKKISELTEVPAAPTELSRKEKEELARQEATRRYQQLHAQGKTDEARADLARLAIIKKQREEAAQKREQEKKDKEHRAQASKEASLNAIKSKGGRSKRK